MAIFDYGVGNLYSLRKALERRGVEPRIIRGLTGEGFEALVLPGVGSFSAAARKMVEVREGLVGAAQGGTPILGVCLGMQLLFERSEEGEGQGLSLMKGEVVKLPSSVKTPHIGWNTLLHIKPSPLTEDVDEGSWVYFVHSYYPKPSSPRVVVASATYGVDFPALVASGNLFGSQFHPEKSGGTGAKILQNFIDYCRR